MSAAVLFVEKKKENIVSKRKAPFLRKDLRVFKMKGFHKLHLIFTLILYIGKNRQCKN